MLSDQDKAFQRDFNRRVRELENLLHDMGSTKRETDQFASRQLAYARTKLEEASLWMREHFFANVISKDQPARPKRPEPVNGATVERKR